MAKLKKGDQVLIGDSNIETDENGTLYQEVTITEKNYSRDGVLARIAVLETELAKFQAILAEIDSGV